MPSRSIASSTLLLSLVLGLCLAACSQVTRYDSEFLAMGTQVQLSLLAPSAAAAARCDAAVMRQLSRQGIDWYPWSADPSSELKRLNTALAASQVFTVSPQMLPLLQRARDLQQRSEGYFDPAVMSLVAAWGFADLTMQPHMPAASVLEQWHHHATLADLRIDGQRISSARRDLQVDLGAIAKGYALQLALQQLRQLGCHDAALNLGGQWALMGKTLAAQAAAIGIREPRGTQLLAKVQLRDGESISTSGDYERYTEVAGRRLHHLLDPHTGMPVQHTQAVTVLHRDATLADAASTALMAAGPAHWQQIARRLGVHEVLRVDDTGALQVSAALYARLQWRPGLPTERITVVNL